MEELEELLACVEAAKKGVEAALERAQRRPADGGEAAAVLIGGAARLARLANGVALLCRYGRGQACGDLARAMVVSALAMCWAVSDQEPESGLQRELAGLEEAEGALEERPAGDRVEREGLSAEEAEAAEAVMRRSGLSPVERAGAAERRTLQLAARALEAARWALDGRWPPASAALPN